MEGWGLRFRFFLFFLGIAVGGIAIVAVALWFSQNRSNAPASGYVIAGIVSAFGLVGLSAWIGFLFDQNVAKPMEKMASELQTRAKLAIPFGIDTESARYLGALAPAAQDIHEALEKARTSFESEMQVSFDDMQRTTDAFERIVGNLADGLIMMSADGRVLLYNRRAMALLGKIGLNRPVSRVLYMDPILDAINRLDLKHSDDETASKPFLTSTDQGKRQFYGSVSNFLLDNGQAAHVLCLRDVTDNLQARAVMEYAIRQNEIDVVNDRALNAGQWPICDIGLQSIFDTLMVRVAEPVHVEPTDYWVSCDVFAVTELFAAMQEWLVEHADVSELFLHAEERDGLIHLILRWNGLQLSEDIQQDWLNKKIGPSYGPYTRKDIFHAHRTTPTFESEGEQSSFTITLTIAPCEIATRSIALPEFYDFDLSLPDGCDLTDRKLSDLSFVVFDTETTGLDRNKDEVVQIAGVRILMGQLLRGETFDELVNPGCTIPNETIKIHGITNEMVVDARSFDTVGEDFARFAEGSVLVAHNASFDMAFLKRLEADKGEELFSNPVLCTGQLSLKLFPHTGDHTLDGLAERFGIEIPEEHRHTALGDSIATAEAFLKMVVLLENQDKTYLRDILSNSQEKHERSVE